MHERQAELTELVRALIDALEASGLPYAIGGAIALAGWSEPRATKDVDVTLFVDEAVPEAAFEALENAGLEVSRDAARAEAARRGMFVLRSVGGYRVDVFVSSIPFYDVAEHRRRRVRLAGREAWILDAESLTVFKLLFFRPKDILDVQRLLELRDLDATVVRDALVETVGEDDVRVKKWDELVAQRGVDPA